MICRFIDSEGGGSDMFAPKSCDTDCTNPREVFFSRTDEDYEDPSKFYQACGDKELC